MSALAALLDDGKIISDLSLLDVSIGFINSIILGFLLYVVSEYAMFKWERKEKLTKTHIKDWLSIGANQVFYCVGITSLLFLVEKSLIRALVMIAIFTLFRFRVQVAFQNLSSSLLFSVVIGLACGSLKLVMAWTVFCVYVLILILLTLKVKWDYWKYEKCKRESKVADLVSASSHTPSF